MSRSKVSADSEHKEFCTGAKIHNTSRKTFHRQQQKRLSLASQARQYFTHDDNLCLASPVAHKNKKRIDEIPLLNEIGTTCKTDSLISLKMLALLTTYVQAVVVSFFSSNDEDDDYDAAATTLVHGCSR